MAKTRHARKAKQRTSARRASRATKTKTRPRKQTFVASHHTPGAFEAGLRRSDDCEMLEVILPADFKTVELK